MPHVTEEIWTHLPARDARLIVSAWPEADGRFEADAEALEQVQTAATLYRRSQVRIDLDAEGRRVFEAVVKPGQVTQDGNVEREKERLHQEIARAEGMLANDRFSKNAPADVVQAEREKLERYRRELEALGG